MRRERVLKAVLVLLGFFFVAGIYPLMTSVRTAWQAHNEDSTPMMLSVYVTLGIFLLLAAGNPSAHRSLIAFTAWSSFSHGGVMAVQSLYNASERAHYLGGTIALTIIGLGLLALAPAKPTTAQV